VYNFPYRKELQEYNLLVLNELIKVKRIKQQNRNTKVQDRILSNEEVQKRMQLLQGYKSLILDSKRINYEAKNTNKIRTKLMRILSQLEEIREVLGLDFNDIDFNLERDYPEYFI